MLNCDECNKNIERGFSEWCVYHHKKRRDFCSLKCIIMWMDEYLKDKGEKKNLLREWVGKEIDILIEKGKEMDKIEFLQLIFLSGIEVGGRK